jgi:hypothetical protein
MTSWRQFQANRLNAFKSTGPRTEEGKRISRRNALRHGLTAETVIDGLEDSEDYRGFEAAIIADYDVETAVERELVLRLASLLWRLRRIIAIETDLFAIQAEILRERRNEMTTVHGQLSNRASEVLALAEADRLGCNGPALSPRELTYCFLRLGIWTAARLSDSVDATPLCGSRPLRPCSCLAPPDAGERIAFPARVEISCRSQPMLNGAEAAATLDRSSASVACRAGIRRRGSPILLPIAPADRWGRSGATALEFGILARSLPTSSIISARDLTMRSSQVVDQPRSRGRRPLSA